MQPQAATDFHVAPIPPPTAGIELMLHPPNICRRQQGTDDASRAAHRAALLKQAGPNAPNVPEAALLAALNMQMVESIPLMANTPQNGFIAVNL